MPIYSLDHVFKQQADRLSRQVIIAQVFGAFFLMIPTIFLRNKFMIVGLFGGFVVLLYTLVFAGFWYRDFIYRKRIPSRLKLDQLRISLGYLVFIDSVVILILIGATGGVSHSHLTGILLLIPCVMSIVAIKPRYFFSIAMMLLVVLIIVVITSILSNRTIDRDPLVIFSSKLGLFCGKSSEQNGYLYAISIVAIFSILLIVLEKHVIKLKLFADKWSFNEIVSLYPLHEYDSFLADDVNRGFKRYSRYLEETNIPDPHISLVHNPQASFSQAYILSYPSYHVDKRNDAADVSFVTFSAHWIDDIFDANYTKEILDVVPEEDLEKLTLRSVCNRLRGIGIEKIVQHVLDCAKDKELVESGLFRVALAGLIQQASPDIMDELVKLYRDTYKHNGKLDNALAKKIDNLDIYLLLTTARTSFGLIMGCESSRKSQERNQLDSFACLFDLILCPLILFHDLPCEMRWEGGILPKCSRDFLNDLIDMAKLAVEKLPDYTDQDAVPGHVRANQLEIVRDLYLDLIPSDGSDFKDLYTEHLNEFINILKRGRHVANTKMI